MDLDEINGMFANIRDNTPWDVTAPLLWGYYFVHSTPEPLQPLGQALATQGYTVVGQYEQAGDADQPPFHVLHVERVEIHDEASLHARDQQLTALAAQMGVEDYDGVDVGPVTPPAG